MLFHKYLLRMKNSTIHCAKNRIALFEQSLRVEVLESQGLTEPNWPIQSWAFSQNIYSRVLFQSVGLPERKPAPKSCLRAPDAETVRWVSLVRKEEGPLRLLILYMLPWNVSVTSIMSTSRQPMACRHCPEISAGLEASSTSLEILYSP